MSELPRSPPTHDVNVERPLATAKSNILSENRNMDEEQLNNFIKIVTREIVKLGFDHN
jgi:hypothetical protein